MTKFLIGDVVQVVSGGQKGNSGAILKLTKDKQRVVIDGVNLRVRSKKARGSEMGDREEFYAPIHISNVAILDPKTGGPTRIGYKLDNGGKTRFAKKSNTDIPGVSTTVPKTKNTKKKEA